MPQFKVINRETKEVQIFNSEQILRFFRCEYDPKTKKIKYFNNQRDYAISEFKSKFYFFNETIDTILKCVVAVAIVVLTTDLIVNLINKF